MIKTTLIHTDDELSAYSKTYAYYAKNNIDLDYLRHATVRIFYKDNTSDVIAGYCIYSGPDNYRSFLPLTSEQLHELSRQQGFDTKPPHEICCLWILPSYRRGIWIIYLYFMMLLDIILLPNRPLIMATHAINIKNFYLLSFPEIIFYDHIYVKTKGEKCDFWIMKGSKSRFLYCYFFLSFIRSVFGSKFLSQVRKKIGSNNKNRKAA